MFEGANGDELVLVQPGRRKGVEGDEMGILEVILSDGVM